jgi:hypothetical protein
MLTRSSAGALALVIFGSASAAAQQPVASQGPLVLEPMHNSFVAAPDVKFTSRHDDTATLVGGYAAWIHDDHLLLGGGAYWRADDHNGNDLGYGGFEAGWIFMPQQRLSVTAKGLVGFGHVEMPAVAVPYGHTPMPVARYPYQPYSYRYHYDVFMAEPELDVRFGLTRSISLQGGVSYRAADEPHGLDTLAQGVAGSVAVQFRVGR